LVWENKTNNSSEVLFCTAAEMIIYFTVSLLVVSVVFEMVVSMITKDIIDMKQTRPVLNMHKD